VVGWVKGDNVEGLLVGVPVEGLLVGVHVEGLLEGDRVEGLKEDSIGFADEGTAVVGLVVDEDGTKVEG